MSEIWFEVARIHGSGFAVLRLDKATLPKAKVVSVHDDKDAAERCAESLRADHGQPRSAKDS